MVFTVVVLEVIKVIVIAKTKNKHSIKNFRRKNHPGQYFAVSQEFRSDLLGTAQICSELLRSAQICSDLSGSAQNLLSGTGCGHAGMAYRWADDGRPIRKAAVTE